MLAEARWWIESMHCELYQPFVTTHMKQRDQIVQQYISVLSKFLPMVSSEIQYRHSQNSRYYYMQSL